MKTKMYFTSLIVMVCLFASQAHSQTSATINPTQFDMNQSSGDPYTIITWNGASSVTLIMASMWGFEFELEENIDYVITDNNGQTAKLTFAGLAKNQPGLTKLNDDIVCTINFNTGNPSVFTITPLVEIKYGVLFWVIDPNGNEINDAVLTFDGITNDQGDYFAGMFFEGYYDYTLTRTGFHTLYGMIYVDGPVSETLILHPEGTSFVPEIEKTCCYLFPNPASEMIFISDCLSEEYTYEILTSDGKKLSCGSHTSRGIDISKLRNGNYYISINTGQNQKVLKFIKQ